MLIAIEGIDGSGKATQTALLVEKARQSGLKVASFSFPGYGKTALGDVVGQYLNGDFGDKNALPPHVVAVLFAGDRYTSREDILRALDENDLVVCDRYVASNMAYQGAKVPVEDRQRFFDWVCSLEYDDYKMPHADLTVYLDMPVETARRLMSSRAKRTYTNLQEDIHEQDQPYLLRCSNVYRFLVEHGIAGPWCSVPCTTPDGEPLSVPQIAQAVWDIARNALASGSSPSNDACEATC